MVLYFVLYSIISIGHLGFWADREWIQYNIGHYKFIIRQSSYFIYCYVNSTSKQNTWTTTTTGARMPEIFHTIHIRTVPFFISKKKERTPVILLCSWDCSNKRLRSTVSSVFSHQPLVMRINSVVTRTMEDYESWKIFQSPITTLKHLFLVHSLRYKLKAKAKYGPRTSTRPIKPR
jgi:hypothetical protein